MAYRRKNPDLEEFLSPVVVEEHRARTAMFSATAWLLRLLCLVPIAMILSSLLLGGGCAAAGLNSKQSDAELQRAVRAGIQEALRR